MWHLLLKGPGQPDTPHALPEGTTRVGRSEDNELVLEGERVSRHHARLHVEGAALRLEDLGSRNGSCVNGEPVQGTRTLQPGDTVTLGEHTLTVRRSEPALPRFELREVGPGTLRLSAAPAQGDATRKPAGTPPVVASGLALQPLALLWAELPELGALAPQLGAARAGALLGEFRSLLYACVQQQGGSVECVLGEGARALFSGHAEDAVRAVRAALALRAEWEQAQHALAPALRCALRVGVHVAQALVGVLGPGAQRATTAVGEGVEVAALLAAGAAPGQVLLSGRALAAVGVRFDVRPLGERLLRAGEPPLRSAVFEVLREEVPVETAPVGGR
ncbi:MAG TPA: FHA domain-containing protein [Aggregicoccus sp.]|nr:FHA domain-containing protein [Aggregicoccus sp.]